MGIYTHHEGASLVSFLSEIFCTPYYSCVVATPSRSAPGETEWLIETH